ncbi:hypothetical protein JCM4814A_03030 [Streptomyces phaeofaciens JCM 4814]|uniref:Uncharacterized protein n=1 Tax=Streptomyces phaeofaciens TaxID=68254 RepID=A0A918M1V1_9ACTN|nr:hypothetical protein GCM10010226_89760 [Streptomyces phaeofaciens]
MLPRLPDTSVAELTITVPVRNAGTADRRATLSAAFDKVEVSGDVTVPAGQTLCVAGDDPVLWWPNGLGAPRFHNLTLLATVDGTLGDRRAPRIGIPPIRLRVRGTAAVHGLWQRLYPVRVHRDTAGLVRADQSRATGWGNSLWSLSVLTSTVRASTLPWMSR